MTADIAILVLACFTPVLFLISLLMGCVKGINKNGISININYKLDIPQPPEPPEPTQEALEEERSRKQMIDAALAIQSIFLDEEQIWSGDSREVR